jgi:hypothetical protein
VTRTQGPRIKQSHANLWTVLGGIAAVLSLAIPLLNGLWYALPPAPNPAPATTRAPVIAKPSPAPSGPRPVVPTTAAAPVVTAPVAGGVLFDAQVRLGYGQGVDLEAGQREGKVAAGPNGPIDLHLGAPYGLRANGGPFYLDTGPEKDSWARCQQAVAAQQGGLGSASIYGVGVQYCFQTSDRRIAWMRINDWLSIYTEKYMVIDVKTWASA